MTAQNNRPSQEIEYIYPPQVLFRYSLHFRRRNVFAEELQICRLFFYTPAKSPATCQSSRHRRKLSQNPEWITALVMTITLHELAHHRFKKDRNSYQLFASEAKEFLQNRPFKVDKGYVPNADFKAIGINLEEIRDFAEEAYDAIIEDDLEDESFLEELAADSFVFNHFSQSLSGCGVNQAIASTMAMSGVCVFFLELLRRDSLYSDSVKTGLSSA